MNGPAALVTLWRQDAIRLGELGQDGPAKLLKHVARELELTLKAEAEQEVTIPEAAEISGYTQDWLRRMVKAGRIAGRRNGSRYLIRVSSLPHRAPKLGVVDELAARRGS